MDEATCTLDNESYDAYSFSRLSNLELAAKRQALICPECKAVAYFRKRSRSGAGPCFGAKPHVSGCGLGSADAVDDPPGTPEIRPERFNRGDRIILDDTPLPEDYHHAMPEEPGKRTKASPEYRGRTLDGNAARAVSHRRLRPILRQLAVGQGLQQSDVVIQYANFAPRPAREFFVEFTEVDGNGHVEQNRGYWGAIVSARFAADGTLYLNGPGGPVGTSVLVRKAFVEPFMTASRVNGTDDLPGHRVLALGQLRISQTSSKKLVHVANPNSIIAEWI